MKINLFVLSFLSSILFINSIFCQYDNTLKSYVPPTPTSASFAKIAEHNMENFSGSSSIMIPITEISDNTLKQEIYLTYQTSGIKAAETASSVGLGWNLSTGGAITRSVRNAPDEHLFDEQITGFYTHPVDPNWFNNVLNANEVLAGKRDVESDIYFYNFGGYSGSFYFGPGQVIIQKDKNDLRIEAIYTNYNFNKFVWRITTPDGTIYHFGDTNGTDGVTDDAVSYSNQYVQLKNVVGAPSRYNPIVDSWFLVKVETFDGSSSLEFQYEKFEAYSFRDVGTSGTGYIEDNGMNIVGFPPLQDANIVLCTESLSPRISKIISDSRIIKFDYSTEVRRDLDNTATSGYHPRYIVGIPENNIVPANALASISVLTPTETLLHKYVLSTDYFRSTAAGFDGTLGLTQQTDGYGSYYTDMRRLRLDSIRCLTSTNEVISRHAFEYNSNIIQRRINYAQDDHGYPNGATGNMTLLPKLLIDTLATSEPMIDLTGIASLANRNPSEAVTKQAMLHKVHYPTGGSRTYDYEGHDFYTNSVIESGIMLIDMRNPNCSNPFSTCSTCCFGATVTSNFVTFSTAPNVRYKMTITGKRTPDDMSNLPIDLQFLVKAGIGGTFILTDNLVLNTANNFDIVKCYAEIDLPPSPTGVYQFQISAPTNRRLFMQFTLTEYTRTDIMINKPVGGLRLKSIADNPNTGPTVTTTYNYKAAHNNNISTGYLVGLPTYCETLFPDAAWTYVPGPNNPQCGDVNWSFNSGNTFVMASIQGSHIGYYRITETVSTGEGSKEILFITDPFHRARYVRNYPAFPEYFMDYKSGYVQSIKKYNNAGALVQSQLNNYFTYDYNNFTPSTTFKKYPICDGTLYSVQNYVIPSRYVRLDSRTTITDGVTTSENFTYDDLPTYIRTTKSSIANSDLKVHATEYKYINSYPFNNTLRAEMIAQHRVNTIWQTTKTVNNVIVDGSQTKFAYVNPTDGVVLSPTATLSGAKIYEASEERREVTWQGNNYTDNGWQLQKTIKKYQLNIGRPSSINVTNWTPDHLLNWSTKGKLLNYTYDNHTKSYSYHAGSDALSQSNDIDGTYNTYMYDDLIRLKETINQPKNVSSSFDYFYANYPTNINQVKSKTKYPLITDSALDSIVTINYLDGLGRSIQTVNKYASPNPLADVITKAEYDNVGRPYRSYEAIEVISNNGTYYTGSFSGGYTQQLFHNDPLNRVRQTTPPAWNNTAHDYVTNQTALTSPDGQVYASSSLIVVRVTDPDNKITETFTDKIGRTLLVRRRDATNTTDTWAAYDDKNRPSKVYPPGSSAATPGLIFEYRYDGDDNVIYKKVPDAVAEEYRYNVRNLKTAMRNGVLQAANRWLVTHYDNHGRPTKRGYYVGADPGTVNEPTITTLLEEYFYDGFDGSTSTADPIYKGKLRKSRVKVLEDGGANASWVETKYSYDVYGRVATEEITNHLGTSETKMLTYDRADNMLSEVHNISGVNGVNHASKYTYDHQGRKIFDKINVDNTGEKTISECKYTHKNQLLERNLGRFATTGTHQYLQSLDYTYNPQGWLTSINNLYTDLLPSGNDPCDPMNESAQEFTNNMNTDVQDMFAQKIDYNANQAGSGGPISNNGNISTLTSWHRGRYNQVYSYTYDHLDRVKKGTQGELAAGVYTQDNHYTERWDYDARGNITKLDRRGMTNRLDLGENCYQPSTIDSLTYTYAPGSNKLVQVTDKAPCPEVITLPVTIDRDVRYAASQEIRIEDTDVFCGVNLRLSAGTLVNILDTLKIPKFCGIPANVVSNTGPCGDDKYTEGFNQQSTTGQYLYDASGNQTFDPNKSLTYHYNYLNLPYRIVGGENDELQMLYSADGTLLQRKYLKNNLLLSKIDYLDGKELLNDIMTNINHQDGRVVKTTSGYSYDYYIKDHLGNVRVIFADDNNDGLIVGNERRSLHDYYAYGLEWNGNWKKVEINNIATNKRYNGKEHVDEMNSNLLLYGARLHMPDLGRFTTSDRFSDKYAFQSTYAYGAGNPIKFIDVNGDSIEIGELKYLPGMENSENYDEYTNNTITALNYIYENGGKKHLNKLLNTESIYSINETKKLNETHFEPISTIGGEIMFNPLNAVEFEDGSKISPTVALAHELDHAFMNEKLLSQYLKSHKDEDADELMNFQALIGHSQMTNDEENRAVKGLERTISKSLGQGIRSNYNVLASEHYKSTGPLSILKNQ